MSSVYVALCRPEGYEDAHNDLLINDALIHPDFQPEDVTALVNALQETNADLLEALKDIVAFWDSVVPEDEINDHHVKARAAIAKAEGN